MDITSEKLGWGAMIVGISAGLFGSFTANFLWTLASDARNQMSLLQWVFGTLATCVFLHFLIKSFKIFLRMK